MACTHVTTRSILSSFMPRLSATTSSNTSRFGAFYSRQLSFPFRLPLSSGFALPPAIQLNLPGLFEGIWESILWAVPKKKTSHMKKRHRQYAGKALKDVTALNKCSACGNVKRAHLLCPYCVNEIKGLFKDPLGEKGVLQRAFKAKQRKHVEENRLKSTAADKPVDGSK